MNLIEHLRRQILFSSQTFGPGPRTQGVIAHIRKELIEIEAAPEDVGEWIDVVLLALDGAWRAGHTPEGIVHALEAKQTRNEGREWPDWRTAPANAPLEHVKGADAAPECTLKVSHSLGEVYVRVTDRAGHRTVAIYTADQAQVLIDDLIEAEAMATSHRQLRGMPS